MDSEKRENNTAGSHCKKYTVHIHIHTQYFLTCFDFDEKLYITRFSEYFTKDVHAVHTYIYVLVLIFALQTHMIS